LLVIRLARTGRTKYPTYRIVAAESTRPATGKFVEILGHYNPHTKELVIKHEETEKRLSQGAQPSNTVVKLLTRDKVVLPAWVKLKTKAPKVTTAAESTEVTETEAAADAEGTQDAPEASDAEALTDETRVASTTEEAAVEAGDDVPNINDTETTASDDAAAADAKAASDVATKSSEIKSDK
jgi:small subunit ribosomal protein S16